MGDAVTEQVGATDHSGSTEEALPSEPNRNSEWSWIRAGLEHRQAPAYKQDTSPWSPPHQTHPFPPACISYSMKFANEIQMQEHSAASRRGAIEGALGGGAVALAGSFWAHKRFPAYHRLPISLKALGVIIVLAPCLSIQAERRGLQYERSQWQVVFLSTHLLACLTHH